MNKIHRILFFSPTARYVELIPKFNTLVKNLPNSIPIPKYYNTLYLFIDIIYKYNIKNLDTSEK